MNKTVGESNFQFKTSASLAFSENQILGSEHLKHDSAPKIKVSTKHDKNVLSDVWAAIALGTVLGKLDPSTSTLWGVTNDHKFDLTKFATSPRGLVSSFLSTKLIKDGNNEAVNRDNIRHWIEEEKEGYVGGEVRGTDRLIVEMDNTRAKTLCKYSRSNKHIDQKAFEALIRKIRGDIELWYDDQLDLFRQKEERAIESLSLFIKELFENAFEHGQYGESLNRFLYPQLRYIRIRKFIRARGDDLIRMADTSIPVLGEYLLDTLRDKKTNVFLELSISDFGSGILDYYLSSPAGRRHIDSDRESVFTRLLYNNLSVKSLDPSAGLGIQNALEAAQTLGAFVSLRTGEFWHAQSFARRRNTFKLKPVTTSRLGHVRGTHWQFIWAPPF